ncbi:MAG TPA: hypothetical protein VHK26_02605, partial [Methyloceanibacter sp.]|nr:hypothetical protein [Methyloceanibacter sp.]
GPGMMGRQKRDQGKLFYEFRLDDRIPKDHLLRRIDVFVTAALADLHPGQNAREFVGRWRGFGGLWPRVAL